MKSTDSTEHLTVPPSIPPRSVKRQFFKHDNFNVFGRRHGDPARELLIRPGKASTIFLRIKGLGYLGLGQSFLRILHGFHVYIYIYSKMTSSSSRHANSLKQISSNHLSFAKMPVPCQVGSSSSSSHSSTSCQQCCKHHRTN